MSCARSISQQERRNPRFGQGYAKKQRGPHRSIQNRSHQSLDGCNALQDEEAEARRHGDGAARARLQHQTRDRDPLRTGADQGHCGFLAVAFRVENRVLHAAKTILSVLSRKIDRNSIAP